MAGSVVRGRDSTPAESREWLALQLERRALVGGRGGCVEPAQRGLSGVCPDGWWHGARPSYRSGLAEHKRLHARVAARGRVRQLPHVVRGTAAGVDPGLGQFPGGRFAQDESRGAYRAVTELVPALVCGVDSDVSCG